MAEMLLKHLVEQSGLSDQFEIDSAAVSTEEIGNDIYPPAQRKLREKGVPFTRHAARQITKADYAYYDHIICMDHSNLRYLSYILGDDPDGKVSLMMDWAEPTTKMTPRQARDVADPWYTGNFEATYRDLLAGCQGLLRGLILKR